MGTTRLENLAAAIPVPMRFQVYVFRDRGLTREFVARCRDAGYAGLCLTVDTPVAGNLSRIAADKTAVGDQSFNLVSASSGPACQMMLVFNSTLNETSLMMDINRDGVSDMVVRLAGDQSAFTGFIL
jgi:isopentenyl diphosphate isomerase/L-lactate dehydrogenase-like FMN-dependent dehydrogenase